MSEDRRCGTCQFMTGLRKQLKSSTFKPLTRGPHDCAYVVPALPALPQAVTHSSAFHHITNVNFTRLRTGVWADDYPECPTWRKGDWYPNGAPKWASDGTLLDQNGNRSIFDDVDR